MLSEKEIKEVEKFIASKEPYQINDEQKCYHCGGTFNGFHKVKKKYRPNCYTCISYRLNLHKEIVGGYSVDRALELQNRKRYKELE